MHAKLARGRIDDSAEARLMREVYAYLSAVDTFREEGSAPSYDLDESAETWNHTLINRYSATIAREVLS